MQPLGNKLLLVIFLILLLDNYGYFRSVLIVNPATKLATNNILYINLYIKSTIVVCLFVCPELIG